jgi:REP element-mobilizing transposase RayT
LAVSRKLRIEHPGAMYHVMNRGDQREDIFRDDEDRQRFLCTLGEACGKTEWQVHAYCLTRNHFHLVLETPQPNLVFGMKWPLGVYTKLDRLLGEKGIPKDSEAGRRQFGSQMERLRGEGTHRSRFDPPPASQSGVSPVPRQPQQLTKGSFNLDGLHSRCARKIDQGTAEDGFRLTSGQLYLATRPVNDESVRVEKEKVRELMDRSVRVVPNLELVRPEPITVV